MTPFLGQLMLFPFNFPPRGWALCNGQLLPINQYQALFSLLGTMYGGDGRQTFALPNLQGRVPLHFGGGFTQGEIGGETAHTLMTSELPMHLHLLQADAATAPASNTDTPASNTVLGQSGGIANPGGPYQVQIYTSPVVSAGPLAAQVVGPIGGGQAHPNL